jgi:Uma2 family endonuclease
MALPAALDLVSIEDYLEFEESSPEKHQLFRGRILSMAGGGSNHADILVSLTGMCRNALQGRKPCRFVGENRTLIVQEMGSGYYPDGTIARPPNDLDRRRGTYDNPTVIFEVLSPSTERFDRTDKADDYKRLSSLQDYVLIESERIRVEVFSRREDGGWLQRVYLPGTVVHLPSVGINLALDELYENALFDEVVQEA